MMMWSVAETRHDEWWAVDARSGMAYLVSPATGHALWSRGNPARAVDMEIERLNSGGSEACLPSVDLAFAGVTARYVCEEEPTSRRLASEFGAAVPRLRSTPDLLVRISAEADIDRLHRAIPNERTGVWTRHPAESEWVPAASDLPLIPPMQGTALGGRFVGLHAALVVTDEGATVIAGRQKSGKTTAARLATAAGLGEPATDELVLLGRQGVVYGVPLPMRIRSENGRGVHPIAGSEALARQPCRATQLLLLRGGAGAAAMQRLDDTRLALAELSEHLRPLALSLGDTARAALELLAHVSTWRLSCRPWPSLADDLEAGLTELSETSAA